MKIYINTEIAHREILSNLLLASLLAVEGHTTVLIHQEDNFVLRLGRNMKGVVFHTKSLNKSSGWTALHANLKRRNCVITSHDQEGSHPPSFKNFVASRYCVENLELADRVFAWNEVEKFWLDSFFPKHSHRSVVTGSPRVDIWGKMFRHLGDHLRKPGPYILLTPSVAINVETRYWRIFASHASTGSFGQEAESQADDFMDYYLKSLKTVIPFCRVALRLLQEFQGHRIVIRPRPGESAEAWKTMLKVVGATRDHVSRILITDEGTLEEWIHGASLVINTNSTAGINAFFSEIPLITFGPFQSPIGKLGLRCESEDDTVGAASVAISDPEAFVSGYRAETQNLLSDFFPHRAGLAADEIVAYWLTHSSGKSDSPLGVKDFLLRFQLGLIRRMVRNSLNFFLGRPQVTLPENSAEKFNWSVVDRQLRTIRDALRIAPEIRFKILGRRNIVVFPISRAEPPL